MQYILIPLTALILLWFVGKVGSVITVFVLGTVLAFILDPVVKRMIKKGFPRWAAILIVFALFLLLITAALSWVIPNLVSEVMDLSTNMNRYLSFTGRYISEGKDYIIRITPPIIANKIGEIDIFARLEAVAEGVLSGIVGYSVNFVSALFEMVLVTIVSIWMLFDIDRVRAWFRGMIPDEYRGESVELGSRLRTAMGGYLKGQLILMVAIGTPVGIAMVLMGVPYAFLIGVWAGITELIPYLGPIIGAAPAVIIALVISPIKALYVALIFLAIQQLESNILAPRIMGDRLGVHPLVILFALISGGEIAGIFGMILSAPIVAVGKVLYDFTRERIELEKWSPPGR